MKEQIYVIKNIKSFEPKHVFECGQCFRWNPEMDGSYTGVIRSSVLNVKKEQNNIIIKGVSKENIKDVCNDYFDLSTDYDKIKDELTVLDTNIKKSIQYGNGIRILHQDLWETLISFIISANNNIPRIKGIIEKLCKNYGDNIVWNNRTYYLFPSPEQLYNASITDLRAQGLGFRDKRVYDTTRLYIEKINKIKQMLEHNNTAQIREELLKFPGVGPKVADCILLFGLKKYEVFPIDVWVKRVMVELYEDEMLKYTKNITPKHILEFANKQFGKYAGLAQQYLFYWRRDLSK